MSARTLLQSLRALPSQVERLRQLAIDARAQLDVLIERPPPPPPPPFIAVLVEGIFVEDLGRSMPYPTFDPVRDEYRRRDYSIPRVPDPPRTRLRSIFVGSSSFVERQRGTIELRADYPLHQCRLTVFADMSRVRIPSIRCGMDAVTGGAGSSPIATFDDWPVGVIVAVDYEIV